MTEQKPESPELVLPPARLRTGPKAQQDDAVYIQNGSALAVSIAQMLQLHHGRHQRPAESYRALSLLDWGCGPARLLTGLQALAVDFSLYVGVDVKADTVDWCRRKLASEHVRFHHLDIQNARYNPKGLPLYQIPLMEKHSAFDLIVLRSVFTHMLLSDMQAHLSFLRGLLAPQGLVYVSVFAEFDVPLETENPTDYLFKKHSGPLHCVRVDRTIFEAIVRQEGFKVSLFCQNVLQQPTFLLEKRL